MSELAKNFPVLHLARGFSAYRSRNYSQAFKEWETLAKAGNPTAEFSLGMLYYKGQGVERNYKVAVKWYTLAANKGDEFGQFNLGWMYEAGKGVARDYQIAAKWYHLAAEKGHSDAQYNLGLLAQCPNLSIKRAIILVVIAIHRV